jgi:hypothetical protein
LSTFPLDLPTFRLRQLTCFIDKHGNETYSINLLSYGLSDHDALILTLNNLKFLNSPNYSVSTRDINEFRKLEFKLNLNRGTWADVFPIEDEVNLMFNINSVLYSKTRKFKGNIIFISKNANIVIW